MNENTDRDLILHKVNFGLTYNKFYYKIKNDETVLKENDLGKTYNNL